MTFACILAMEHTPAIRGLAGRGVALAWPLLAGAAAYLVAARVLRLEEVWVVFRRKRAE
jgi:hypothetical protein